MFARPKYPWTKCKQTTDVIAKLANTRNPPAPKEPTMTEYV